MMMMIFSDGYLEAVASYARSLRQIDELFKAWLKSSRAVENFAIFRLYFFSFIISLVYRS